MSPLILHRCMELFWLDCGGGKHTVKERNHIDINKMRAVQ